MISIGAGSAIIVGDSVLAVDGKVVHLDKISGSGSLVGHFLSFLMD